MGDSGSKGRASFGKRSGGSSLSGALARTRPVRYLKTGTDDPAERDREDPEGQSPSAEGAEAPSRNVVHAVERMAAKSSGEPPEERAETRGESEVTLLHSSPRVRGGSGAEAAHTGETRARDRRNLEDLKAKIMPGVLEQIDYSALVGLTREQVLQALEPIILREASAQGVSFNTDELSSLREALLNEIIGFGPLEPLLEDPSVNDILVNGAHQVFAEREGRLEQTEITFRDDDHVMQIANRICNWVGRRVDIRSPMADARLPDGSRVNIIVPPLALKGPSISIRKFNKHKMELSDLVERGTLSKAMAEFLQVVTNARLNILVAGGTGSGKTTLLNALSHFIDPGERIVTVEDSAELQLHQPHVVPLETRPRNVEGEGEITIRDLLVNALRMRPDRIIVGEVRGEECFDMLQAFNTGHDGGMCTLHANRPREALSRLENLVAMGNPNYPTKAVRQQIAETIDLIVQVKRMRDGVRRITEIVEVAGMNGEMVTTQPLYTYELADDPERGTVTGRFVYTGSTLTAATRVREAGLGDALNEALR